MYGATLVEVDATYDDVNRLCAEVADEQDWAFVNVNLRPYYVEGSKTIAFETAEQLGWELLITWSFRSRRGRCWSGSPGRSGSWPRWVWWSRSPSG